jgi:PAS domain S-box-containing protein
MAEGVGLLLLSGLLDSQPRVVFEVAVALATVLISLVDYYARVRGTGLPFLYMWCTPFAYWFFPRRRALLQGGLVVVGFAAAAIAASRAHPAIAGTVADDWGPILLLAGTVVIVGELVRRLGLTIEESHRRFARVFAEAPTPMARIDLNGRYTDANAAFCHAAGRERAEVIGATVADLAPGEQLPALLEIRSALLAGRLTHRQFDAELERPDGSRTSLVVNVSLLGPPGRPDVEMFMQALDVSRRREAEEALRVSEERLRAVIDNAPASITIRDVHGRLTAVNREAARLMGAEPEALLGQTYREHHSHHEAEELRLNDERVLEDGEPMFYEQTVTRPDGEHILLAAAFPLPAAGTEGMEVCRISFDVTDRERARQELVRSNEQRRRLLAELVRAQEAERRRIAAYVHDDSIQVLAGVAIRLGMLAGMLERPEQQRLIAGLDDSVRRGIRSLRQLLFDLRLPALDKLGLAAALRSYLSETIAREGVTYTLDDSLGSEPPDELRTVLYRVAQEALSNVRKHAEPTHVAVSLTGSVDGFTVTVRDDGVGFDAGQHPDEVPGHLGLVGMRERVEAAGGWIEVRSEPDCGTTVVFGVPLEQPAAALAVARER